MNVKTISILILTVSIPCFVYSVNSASWGIDEVTRISEIIDGDTFDTASGDRIRLADIDAPENDEAGYLQAKYFLYGLLYGRAIYLDIDDLYRYDTSGTRLVCVVYIRHNQTHLLNVNKALVENDFAEIKDYPNEFDPYTWNTFVYYSESEGEIAILDALDFVETQLNNYVDDKWLCREFPNASSYWIYNDNYLAYKILEYFNRSVSASKIRDTIESYGISLEGNERLEVLFNRTIPFPPYTGTGMIIHIEVLKRFTVRNDQKHLQIHDWKEYADLLLFSVIDRYYRGNSTYKGLWNKAHRMFDGKGMVDKVFNETKKYETYKLALFVITSKIINNQTMATDCALSIVWKMQDESNGGVTTHYLPDLTPDPNSTQNIETTCLTIYSCIPEEKMPIPEFPSFLILPLFMIATLLTVIVHRRKHSIESMT